MEGRLVWELSWSNLIDSATTTATAAKQEVSFSSKGIRRKKQIEGDIVVAVARDQWRIVFGSMTAPSEVPFT